MRHTSPPVQRLDQLLKSDPGQPLGKIVQHAQNMGNLTDRLRTTLAADLAPHLLAANLHEDGQLILICSSPSWAARLRFESDRLLAAAAAGGVTAHCLRVRVATGR